MNTARTRLAIAELTATLTTDFDLLAVLDAIAENARACFDAYSAVVVLVFHRSPTGEAEVQIVAEALRDGRLRIEAFTPSVPDWPAHATAR